jgi:Protein involved in mRNA turnover and stability
VSDKPLEAWQVESNRWKFIRKRAEIVADFANRAPCLSYGEYFEMAEAELTRLVKWEDRPAYYSTPYGADGVCPVDWQEYYAMEGRVKQRLLAMGQSEYDQWRRRRDAEEEATREYRARRNAEVDWSLARSRDAIARHSGRTTKQQKEHERSGNYPW